MSGGGRILQPIGGRRRGESWGGQGQGEPMVCGREKRIVGLVEVIRDTGIKKRRGERERGNKEGSKKRVRIRGTWDVGRGR